MDVDLHEHWFLGRRRDPRPSRPRAHGRRERPGVPPAGPTPRRGARLLRDGLGRGDPAPQRAHARLPARRLRRASARDPDLRLRPGRDGRGRAHGRGGRRGHRRHQLRLPGPEGDEDRRRRLAARRPGPRRADRRVGGRGDRAAGVGEDAPRHAERLARLPRRRAAPRRGGRRVAHPPPPLGEADVHRHRRPLADGRARRARRRARDRVGRRHLARPRPGGARDDRSDAR